MPSRRATDVSIALIRLGRPGAAQVVTHSLDPSGRLQEIQVGLQPLVLRGLPALADEVVDQHFRRALTVTVDATIPSSEPGARGSRCGSCGSSAAALSTALEAASAASRIALRSSKGLGLDLSLTAPRSSSVISLYITVRHRPDPRGEDVGEPALRVPVLGEHDDAFVRPVSGTTDDRCEPLGEGGAPSVSGRWPARAAYAVSLSKMACCSGVAYAANSRGRGQRGLGGLVLGVLVVEVLVEPVKGLAQSAEAAAAAPWASVSRCA